MISATRNRVKKWMLTMLGLAVGYSIFGQVITNKNFNYFDLMQIENNEFQHQTVFSVSFDEIGWQGQLYKVKKDFFSLQFGASYKRHFPNPVKLFLEPTLYLEKIFPMNGLTGSIGFRWYFNQRRFSFTGMRIYSGYFWTLDKQNAPDSQWGQNRMHYKLYWTNNFRNGFDLLVGRKFVNKFISEIVFLAGYRIDRSVVCYECTQNCPLSNLGITKVDKGLYGFPHFQIILGFDFHTH